MRTFKSIIAVMAAALCMQACSNGGNNGEAAQVEQTSVNIMEYTSPNPEGMQEVCDFLQKCGYYFIATTEGDQPRVRPFGTAHIFDGKLYIQTGHIKDVSKQIDANPKVEICAYDGATWMRIAATLVEDARIEAKKSMLDANPSLRSMYSEEDDNTALYALTSARVRVCSFAAPERIIEF